MRKYLIISACLALVLSSCKGGSDWSPSPEDYLETPWTEVSPESLVMAPVSDFSTRWMALSVSDKSSVGAMTVSWGEIGQLWGKPVVTVFVSGSRHTHSLLDQAKYFTLSTFPDSRKNKEALVYLGTHSGSTDPDKISASGLNVELSELGNPLFKEASRAFECKILYKDEFKLDRVPSEVKPLYDSVAVHTFYVGEIVKLWEKHPVPPRQLLEVPEQEEEQ